VEGKDFVSAYAQLNNGATPGFLADYGYDTFMLYMNTYDKDGAKWIANLKAANTVGASGRIVFDHNGVRISDLVIKKVINGESKTIYRLPYQTP
jgi:hypothetical protein